MEQNNQVQEVSLRRMFYAVGYRWKRIVAAALVFAVLLGGIQGIRVFAKTAQGQTAAETYEPEQAQLSRRIELQEKSIAEQKAYLSEALLMQVDPYHIYQAKGLIHIAAEDPAEPETESQDADTAALLAAYYTLANTQEATETVAAEAGVETDTLSGLVNVYIQQDRNLQIAVYNPDAQTARRILSAYLNYLDGHRPNVSTSISQHDYSIVFETVGLSESTSLQDKQDAARTRLVELEEDLKTLQNEYESLVGSSQPAGVGAVAKEIIKWAVLGGIAGAVLAAALTCVEFVCGDRVYSAEELRCRLGIRTVGGFWAGKEKCGRVASRLMEAEDRVCVNSGANLDLIVANICSFAANGETVLITGAKRYGDFVAQLQQRLPDVKLVCGGSLMTDAASVQFLRQSCGVILLVQRGCSRYSGIAREMERINDAGKRLIGCIIAEQ